MLQTRKASPYQPPRVLIYGPEGCGKSTFGAKADRPLFLSPEGGTGHLKTQTGESVDEVPGITSWTALVSAVKSVLNEKHDFKTLVIDSADWVESLAHKHIIGNSNKSIVTVNGGYGAGYRQSQAMHKDLIADLQELREQKNMNVVVTAHAHVKPVKDPEMPDDYDSYEIKCHEFVSSLWREWVDALLFARFKTFTKSSEDTTRARALSDGTRVVFTVKQPFCQAKNRYGLPESMPFTENYWNDFVSYTQKTNDVETLRKQLEGAAAKLKDEKTSKAALDFISKAKTREELLTAQSRLNQIS